MSLKVIYILSLPYALNYVFYSPGLSCTFYVAEAGLKLLIFLPLCPKYWDYKLHYHTQLKFVSVENFINQAGYSGTCL